MLGSLYKSCVSDSNLCGICDDLLYQSKDNILEFIPNWITYNIIQNKLTSTQDGTKFITTA